MRCAPHAISNLFRSRGLRRTKQREAIYGALAASRAHPTAEELFAVVRGGESCLSLATVYNTLEAFVAAGLAQRVPPADGFASCRYDADTTPHAHVELSDGRVMDVPSDLSGRLLAGIPGALIAEIEHRLDVSVRGLSLRVLADAPGPALPGRPDVGSNPEES